MATTINALFTNVLEPGFNRIFKEKYKMAVEESRTNILTHNTSMSNITWTAAGDNSSTTHGIIYQDTPSSFDQGTITVRFTDSDIEEKPPKTYLSLPTGKRLISI